MKIKNIRWLLIVLSVLILSCKKEIKKANYNTAKTKSDTISFQPENKTDEIFVGKIFFAGDQLNNYSFISSKNFNKGDSLSYSIYKQNNQDEYVLSIEKLISNEDQEKYKIIDIFRFTDYSANTKIKLNQEVSTYNVLLINNGKTQKKWTF